MPCAAGELLCLVPDRTPERPDGLAFRAKCGGGLHGKKCCEVTIRAADVWATAAEDQEDAVEAMRLDAIDMTEKLSATHV